MAAVLVFASPAHALTLDQVMVQAEKEVDMVTLELVAALIAEGMANADVAGSVTECRRTSRQRGSCEVDASDANSGAWCSAIVVVRETPHRRITRSVRDMECSVPEPRF